MTISRTENRQDQTQEIPMIGVRAVGKRYPMLEGVWALKDVSCDVQKGEILGIIGRNGAGKTTLLNIIAGTLTATEGECRRGGRVVGLFNLGVGFQDELSGRENIFLNGAILGSSKKELEAKLAKIIAFSELEECIDLPLGSFSQGMRLRLAFSIIANLDFDALVIDEVLTVGDTLFQDKCLKRLLEFRQSGKSLVITTQSLEMIERLCARVVVLSHGRVAYCGEVHEGINRYRQIQNSEKFSVGPVLCAPVMCENTKKWADDIAAWGRRIGTKEVTIENVEFLHSRKGAAGEIRSADPLTIRMHCNVHTQVHDPHFGIAIFRHDGVYCYGPNTAFDGYTFPALKKGTAICELHIASLLLAPGEYRVSAAIWDKDEAVPFDYHEGVYTLKVSGKEYSDELVRMGFSIFPRRCAENFFHPLRAPDADVWQRFEEAAKGGNPISADGVRVRSCDGKGIERATFSTNEEVQCSVDVRSSHGLPDFGAHGRVWVAIYRDDDIMCQRIDAFFPPKGFLAIRFRKLPLLPGLYRVSAGMWHAQTKEVVLLCNKAHEFRMQFNRYDHGTVYLAHAWRFIEKPTS